MVECNVQGVHEDAAGTFLLNKIVCPRQDVPLQPTNIALYSLLQDLGLPSAFFHHERLGINPSGPASPQPTLYPEVMVSVMMMTVVVAVVWVLVLAVMLVFVVVAVVIVVNIVVVVVALVVAAVAELVVVMW